MITLTTIRFMRVCSHAVLRNSNNKYLKILNILGRIEENSKITFLISTLLL